MSTKINFIITINGETSKVETREGEYRNLMQLIADKFYISDFGACGGQGRCATCLVKINSKKTTLSLNYRNEVTTLLNAGITEIDTRLSCQIMITKEIDEAHFVIVE